MIAFRGTTALRQPGKLPVVSDLQLDLARIGLFVLGLQGRRYAYYPFPRSPRLRKQIRLGADRCSLSPPSSYWSHLKMRLQRDRMVNAAAHERNATNLTPGQ